MSVFEMGGCREQHIAQIKLPYGLDRNVRGDLQPVGFSQRGQRILSS